MNKLLNDIKELSSFYKALAILLAAISYIFVPPLFSDNMYLQAMVDWVIVAFWVFLSALILGGWICKCADADDE